jgi:hypothetical protein
VPENAAASRSLRRVLVCPAFIGRNSNFNLKKSDLAEERTMPDKKQGDDNARHKELKQDDLIERLVPDPANIDVVKLAGMYLGNSDRENCWRLYLTINLNHYLEFPKADTIDAQRLPSGSFIVWLKPGARVQERITRSAPAEFLQGDILNRHLSRTTDLSALRRMFPIVAADCGQSNQCPSAFPSPFCNTKPTDCAPC